MSPTLAWASFQLAPRLTRPGREHTAWTGPGVVVGTGIRVVGQMTTEAVAWIRVSDKVLYLAHDPVARRRSSRA